MVHLTRDLVSGELTVDGIADQLTKFIFEYDGEDLVRNYDDSSKSMSRIIKACILLSKSLTPNTKRDISQFTRHAKRFISIYCKNSGVEIERTFRYQNSGKVEYKLQATREWEVGEEINFLTGTIVELTRDNESQIASRDFSIMYSSKRQCNCLFCGPARFMNHDCESNCKFIPSTISDITFKVTRPILPGDELTTFYSHSYFGEANCDCLCASCERNGRNGYGDPNSSPKLPVLDHFKPAPEDEKRATKSRNIVYDFSTTASSFMKPAFNVVSKNTFTVKPVVDGPCCVVCGTGLDETTRNEKQLDFSIMYKTHCRRCYRHELIYDIEWPVRVRQLVRFDSNAEKATKKMYHDAFYKSSKPMVKSFLGDIKLM